MKRFYDNGANQGTGGGANQGAKSAGSGPQPGSIGKTPSTDAVPSAESVKAGSTIAGNSGGADFSTSHSTGRGETSHEEAVEKGGNHFQQQAAEAAATDKK